MSTAPKKEHVIVDKIMGDEALQTAIVNYIKHTGFSRIFPGVDQDKAKSALNLLRIAAANNLNADVGVKKVGISQGCIIKDMNTQDIVYIKHDITSNKDNNALKFAFISKLLHKTSFGPLCDFFYDKKENKLITLSAKLGHVKKKEFHECKLDNPLLNPGQHGNWNKKYWSKEQKEVDNAIKAIGSIGEHLQIGDLKGADGEDGNFGVTFNGTSYKPKIFDFSPYPINHICGLYSSQRPHTDEREGYIKQYAKDWQENDTLDTYIKRKFAETLDDPKFQKLLTVMPEEQRAKLDEYCKQIVGMDVVGVKLGNHFNNNSSILTNSGIMTFDNIGDNEDRQIFPPSKLSEHFNNQPEGGLNFDNIGDNELVQIGLTSKPKEVKSCLSGCVNSKKNRVDIAR